MDDAPGQALRLAHDALFVLVGASGCGKSAWASTRFRPDHCCRSRRSAARGSPMHERWTTVAYLARRRRGDRDPPHYDEDSVRELGAVVDAFRTRARDVTLRSWT